MEIGNVQEDWSCGDGPAITKLYSWGFLSYSFTSPRERCAKSETLCKPSVAHRLLRFMRWNLPIWFESLTCMGACIFLNLF
jgi:hypothetical protein